MFVYNDAAITPGGRFYWWISSARRIVAPVLSRMISRQTNQGSAKSFVAYDHILCGYMLQNRCVAPQRTEI
jgi:hypothetical protein